MTATVFEIISTAMLYAFVMCCVLSALLQIIAWSRHAREGVPVSLRALWKPEGHFDEIGIRQIQLARRLLLVGGVAYVSFGAMTVAASLMQ
jgi:hypothetical protein